MYRCSNTAGFLSMLLFLTDRFFGLDRSHHLHCVVRDHDDHAVLTHWHGEREAETPDTLISPSMSSIVFQPPLSAPAI